MENSSTNVLTEEEQRQFLEFKRLRKLEEAKAKIAKMECDCLSAYTEKSAVRQLCRDGDRLGLGAVVVLPSFVKPCVAFLGKDPRCGLIAAISYPHGGDVTEVKAAAVKRAVKDGVDEVEVCAPTQVIKDGNLAYFKRECRKLRRASKKRALRITLDCAALTPQELMRAVNCAADSGVNVIRLTGAVDHDTVRKVRAALKDRCLMKIEGVESAAQYDESVALGASSVSCKNAVELATLMLYEAKS